MTQDEQTAAAPSCPEPTPDLGRVVPLLALACGLTVANLYYAQPLLGPIARSFRISTGAAASVVTLTQFGYAVGLILLVPLGDLVENRRLITRILLCTAVALTAAAAAPSIGLFLAASMAVGVTSVVVQIVLPLAAALAPEAARGRVLGQVTSGLLIGVLLARSVSSLVADLINWRAIYVISAVMMLLLSLLLRRYLSAHEPAVGLAYRSLLFSVARLLRTEPLLRRRSFYQAMMFGVFSLYWSSVALELTRVHHLSQAKIGLFALVGAAGAAAAPLVGRWADAEHGDVITGGGMVLAVAGLVTAAVGYHHLFLLALAAVMLDFAMQATQVTGQRAILNIRPGAAGRLNTAYIAMTFAGGTAGSALSGWLYATRGWTATTLAGVALPCTALAVWAWSVLGRRRG